MRLSPDVQQIAWLDTESGECGERRFAAQQWRSGDFLPEIEGAGSECPRGIEATGHARWFERLLAELEYELWVGDPAQIKAKRVRKQKYDQEGCPTPAEADDGKSVPAGVGTRCRESRSAATAVAPPPAGADANAGDESTSGRGSERGSTAQEALWSDAGRSQLESFRLGPWATRRRQDLLSCSTN